MWAKRNTTPSLALSLYSAQSGKVYLRLLSHGNYTGSGWDPASDYQGLLDRTYSMNYLTGAALASAGYQKTFLSLKVYCSDYYIPYYPAMGEAENYTVQTSDVWYKSGNEKIYNAYSLYSYLYDAVSDEAIEAGLGAYASVEEEYHAYVNKMYLATSGMSEELQTYFTSEIAEKGLKEGDIWQQIRSVAAYIQDAAEYNLDYNTALDDKADVIYAFLTEYKQGVCRHYASAATMLFRMLGIPARYTQGYVADAVANEWVDVMSTNAHAWVEVYIGGIGWVQVEVTGGGPGFGGGGGQGGEEGGGEQGGGEQGGGEGGEGGEQGGGEGGGGEGEGEGPGGGEQGGEQKEKLTVRPVDEYLQVNTVDATVSLKHTGTLQGLYDLEKKGYRYEVTVAGEQTKVGIGDCTIVESSFRLFDAAGKDVTDEYDITFQTGTLQVYVEELTVKTGEKSGVYNGLPLTDARCEVTGLLAGHTCTAKATGSITNVGSTPNTAEVTVEDAGGNDVTYMYRIINDYGTLTVTPRAITVQADSATKTFDPNNRTPLTAPDAEITAGSLADGHKATFTTKGSQTNVGYSENIVSEVKIVDENGNDVTANYKITKLPGTLTVTPPNQ